VLAASARREEEGAATPLHVAAWNVDALIHPRRIARRTAAAAAIVSGRKDKSDGRLLYRHCPRPKIVAPAQPRHPPKNVKGSGREVLHYNRSPSLNRSCTVAAGGTLTFVGTPRHVPHGLEITITPTPIVLVR
jgi:hypothetical protein